MGHGTYAGQTDKYSVQTVSGCDGKANPFYPGWPKQSAACNAYSSRISTAAAIVVVHNPRLSPTADCVILLVRTILLEMR